MSDTSSPWRSSLPLRPSWYAQTCMPKTPKKARATALETDVARFLAEQPGGAPRVLAISRGESLADRRVFTVDVQYPGEQPKRVQFAGPSRDIVGPVVMISGGGQTFVHDPSRFGPFGRDWVRRFFES